MFTFKQFVIHQDRCAQKVGTDGVLLGALCKMPQMAADVQVLDIGTGTGLVGIMVAQRLEQKGVGDYEVLGLDIDSEAIEQARQNAESSPFASHVQMQCTSFQEFETDKRFDLVVCNPPFYNGTLTCPDDKRTLARHATSLPFKVLVGKVAEVLAEGGFFEVIVPMYARAEFVMLAEQNSLELRHQYNILTTPTKDAKRVVLRFCKEKREDNEFEEENFVLEESRGVRSPEYAAATRDFYIK